MKIDAPPVKSAIGQMNLADILSALWAGRTTILFFVVVGFFLSVVDLHLAKYTYSAELTVIPTQSQGDGAGLSQTFGDLASLAGVNLNRGGQGVAPFALYPAVLQ